MAEHGPQEKGFGRRPKVLDYLGAGGASEEEAREAATGAVRHVREMGSRFVEGPAPDPDRVRERREAHQHSRQA